MARKAADGINRSKLIRDYKRTKKGAGPKAIAELLASEHGVEVSAQYVSTVLSTAKKKGGKIGRPGRRPGTGTNGALNTDKLLRAKEFISEMGGVDGAKAAIELLAQLTG
jgi:hypothetical protein